ncbi:hypothetical protein K435DRAFT_828084 [Dendrothele bispora CBS 962.96]|uniref:Uncharacterized protein n=1 Tax=Dendrothele bispora (strain CBS 962.96) TaxID=1314807 RepID=A0A4S8MBY4_DENBC|nr:hypothetical protein K435DRAFT_828084 [Dendrothele bispora CBS 962.96]
MSSFHHPSPAPSQDVVSFEQYQYALTNFRIAHEKVEQQRQQLEEQERQVAQLRARIALLEGGSAPTKLRKGANTVDDFSIKNAASQLEKMINRWASDVVRNPPVPFGQISQAILNDITTGPEAGRFEGTSMQVQALLRHAMSEAISEGIINCLIVTNSSEANIQLTRIHEHLFARDPTVACVWRRQTFSAAVEQCTPIMSHAILLEQIPELVQILDPSNPSSPTLTLTNQPIQSILQSAYDFSRMLHGSAMTSGGASGDAFYRAFVPELGSALQPRQIELVKRCLKSERGELDRVGATIFPGLVKVSRAPNLTPGFQEEQSETLQTVVRRAQVVCECALGGIPDTSSNANILSSGSPLPLPNGMY